MVPLNTDNEDELNSVPVSDPVIFPPLEDETFENEDEEFGDIEDDSEDDIEDEDGEDDPYDLSDVFEGIPVLNESSNPHVTLTGNGSDARLYDLASAEGETVEAFALRYGLPLGAGYVWVVGQTPKDKDYVLRPGDQVYLSVPLKGGSN